MFEYQKNKNTSDVHMIKTIKLLKYLVSMIKTKTKYLEKFKMAKKK